MTVILITSDIRMTGGSSTHHADECHCLHNAIGNFESAFNLRRSQLCGAVYVARWTAFHVRHTTKAIKEALLKKALVRRDPCTLPPTVQPEEQAGGWARTNALLPGEQ